MFNKNQPDDYYRRAVFDEHLRQAKRSFNLHTIATGLSLSVSALGAFLILSGKVTEGTVTTASGLLSSAASAQIAKESSKQLNDLRSELTK